MNSHAAIRSTVYFHIAIMNSGAGEILTSRLNFTSSIASTTEAYGHLSECEIVLG